MNHNTKLIATLLLGVFACSFMACKKKEVALGTPPSISFKTETGYYSVNDTVENGTVVKVGIIASSNSSPDELRNLYIKRAIDNGEEEAIKDVPLTGADRKNYSGDFSFKLVTPGKQKYTFIILNTHGLENEKTITFTVRE